MANAKAGEERKQVEARLRTLPLRFLTLAETNPNDPIALEALVQTVSWVNSTAFPAGGKDSPGERALALLLRDHVKSDKLGPVCQQIVFGFHKSYELFLREVLQLSPHAEVQALARLSLAQFLNNRLQRLEVLKDQDRTDFADRYHRVFGKDCVEELQRQDREKIEREVESLFDGPPGSIPMSRFPSRTSVRVERSARKPRLNCSRSAIWRSGKSRPKSRARTNPVSASS